VYDSRNPKEQACIQYLADKDPAEHRRFFGRRLNADQIDIELLRSWMGRCVKWHGDQYSDECERSGISAQALPNNLRLIDVRNTPSIVKVKNTTDLRYVALSYVWGEQKMRAECGMEPAILKRENVMYGQPTLLPQPLPQTIKDAIRVIGELGFKYLWVDALCIVQNDAPEQKNLHISKMDAIYNRASLTIAAGAGDHANYGLPGISMPRKESQYSEVIKGLRFATMFPSYTSLESSNSLYWNTRGWTFQEKLLSKRIMLFTDQQVYFKCAESIWTEEIHMETGRLSNSLESRRGKYRWRPDVAADTEELRKRRIKANNTKLELRAMKLFKPLGKASNRWQYLGVFPYFAAAIQEYTTRNLTSDKDKLLAIEGVLRTMEPCAGGLLQGIPEHYLLDGLLWLPVAGSVCQRSDFSIPSWSWAGWTVQGRGVVFNVMDLRAVAQLLRLSDRLAPKDDNTTIQQSSSEISSADVLTGLLLHATANFFACIAGALLQPDHTAKDIVYRDGPTKRDLTFVTPTHSVASITPANYDIVFRGANWWTSVFQSRLKNKPRRLPHISSPYLVMDTIVIRLSIGNMIRGSLAPKDDETAVFELLDRSGFCVGEITTTQKVATEASDHRIDLLCISWGLGLRQATKISDTVIPRWRFGLGMEQEAIKRFMGKGYALAADEGPIQALRSKAESFLSKDRDGKIWGDILAKIPLDDWLNNQDPGDNSSLSSILESLLQARKGHRRPREMWTVVNVISVEWEGPIARRTGVGRVMLDAWLKEKGDVETVFLA
jgi:hypothetical protein